MKGVSERVLSFFSKKITATEYENLPGTWFGNVCPGKVLPESTVK